MWPEWSCACKCSPRRALSSPHRWALYVAGMLMVLYGLYLISIDSARISVVSSVVGGGGGSHLEAAGGAKTSGGAQMEIAQEEPFTDGFARRRLRFEGEAVVGEAVMGEAVKATASEGAALPDGAVVGAADETDPERTISNSSTSSESMATASTTTLSKALTAALPLKVIVPTATSPSVSRLGSFHGLSQRTDRENVRDNVRDKSLSRNPTPSELIHELLHNPAPSLLPSPFTVYGMASGEGRSPSSGHLGSSRDISGHLGVQARATNRTSRPRWRGCGEMAGRRRSSPIRRSSPPTEPIEPNRQNPRLSRRWSHRCPHRLRQTARRIRQTALTTSRRIRQRARAAGHPAAAPCWPACLGGAASAPRAQPEIRAEIGEIYPNRAAGRRTQPSSQCRSMKGRVESEGALSSALDETSSELSAC